MGVMRTEVDGVPVFFADPVGPLLNASLLFRVGRADEEFTTSGWVHLLEHLALRGPFSRLVTVNGAVDLFLTSLDVEGEPDDVADCLAAITKALSPTNEEHFAREARVLAEEAKERQISPLATALAWRYGARGPGLAGWREQGLTRATPDALAALAGRVFTRGNAALWLSGPVPAGLRLHLPDGPLVPVPIPSEWEQPLPSIYGQPAPAITVTGIVERSEAAIAASLLLTNRVFQRLRTDEGLTYTPVECYEIVGRDHALAGVSAGIPDDQVAKALPMVIGALRDLADNGPGNQELADHVAVSRRRFAHRLSDLAQARTNAVALLFGRPLQNTEESRASLERVDADAVAAAASSIAHTMLIGVPRGSKPGDVGIPIQGGADNARLPGRIVRPRGGVEESPAVQLVLNAPYLQWQGPSDRVTMDLTYLAGMLAWPDGARAMIRPDGFSVLFEPTLWSGGQRVTQWIDARVPPGVVLPQPPRAESAIPRPPTLRQRLARVERLTLILWVLLVVLLGCWVFVGATGFQVPDQLRWPFSASTVGAALLLIIRSAQRQR